MRYLIVALMLFISNSLNAQNTTIYQKMKELQKTHQFHFIYDSNLNLNIPHQGYINQNLPLKEILHNLFDDQNIKFKIQGKNILLKKERAAIQPKFYSVRGIVTDSVGERLINASIYDIYSQKGTLSDEHGQYAISLPKGKHKLRVAYFGVKQKIIEIDLQRNEKLNFILNNSFDIKEVTIWGDMNSPVLSTQTGKRILNQDDIKTEFSLLSSPDVIKTLQRTSGVNSGTELTSGLFVHGGNNDENLFLLDGTPLYQTNHSLGLFSSFNVDVIKNVDFYKSGFPARYTGRVSSITDIRTKDGNMQKTHGLFSIGLLDGRIQLEGPIKKDHSSFNIAIRRSWLDLLLKPAYAIINKNKEDGEKYSFGYAFHDINAKITQKLTNNNKMWFSIYSGRDCYDITDESSWTNYITTTNNNFNWGNFNATIGANLQLSSYLNSTIALIGTYSYSIHNSDEDDTYQSTDGIIHRNSLEMQYNKTQMYDIGLKSDFIYTYLKGNRIRFGCNITHHAFFPQTNNQSFYFTDENLGDDKLQVTETSKASSCETTFYLEDDMNITNKISANIGTSYTLFHAKNRNYGLLDPRLAMRWQIGNETSLKFSITHMSQSIHKITSTFLEIPSDFWVPTTDKIKPTKSTQIAGGIYTQYGKNWIITIEGFYKRTNHLLLYKHWMGLQPPAVYWDRNVTEGIGKSYGVEIDTQYKSSILTGTLSYTLLFNKRYFPQLYTNWFNDQFDNRHKLDITVRYNVNKKISAYAAFVYKSGNRMSFPTHYNLYPTLPDEKRNMEIGYIYTEPNNLSLPAYHRLDLGCNFRHTTQKGREVIWNISLYNAYCHLNTMYAKIQNNADGTFTAQSKGFIPIIPSISYTIKF